MRSVGIAVVEAVENWLDDVLVVVPEPVVADGAEDLIPFPCWATHRCGTSSPVADRRDRLSRSLLPSLRRRKFDEKLVLVGDLLEPRVDGGLEGVDVLRLDSDSIAGDLLDLVLVVDDLLEAYLEALDEVPLEERLTVVLVPSVVAAVEVMGDGSGGVFRLRRSGAGSSESLHSPRAVCVDGIVLLRGYVFVDGSRAGWCRVR